MKKIELIMEYDFNGYFKDELEGVENLKVIDKVSFDGGEYGYGYYVVQGECKALEDVAYTDTEHNKWYLDTADVMGSDDMYYPSIWSPAKLDKVTINDLDK